MSIIAMVDTHAHLTFPDFQADLSETIARAKAAGVDKIINIGTDSEHNAKAIELTKKYDGLFAAAGLHPHEAQHFSDELLQKMEEFARHPKVVAIGETGLDFYRNYAPAESQYRAFEAQVELARKTGKTLVMHIRAAFKESWGVLEKADLGEEKVVLHCFGEGIEEAKKAIEKRYFLSFNGTLTFPKSTLPEVVKILPLDLILTETDCPYLAPVPHRGKRNEPAYIPVVVEKLAAVLGRSKEELAEVTATNAARAFGI
ncbi:MAG: TatD family hydrolase [candidate division Zixibacteria bacterium]|nr:TatD family hydrolase [candidate division Zixibacteria bacterium]